MEFDKIRSAVNSIEMSEAMKYRLKNCYASEKMKKRNLNTKRWISVAVTLSILLIILVGVPILNRQMFFKAVNFEITAYAGGVEGNPLKTNTLSEEKTNIEFFNEERMDNIVGLRGGGANLIFTDVLLKVTGENIESITYTINKGKFVKDVTFASDKNNNEWLLSERIYIVYSEFGSDIYKGIKEIGNTYTVMYNDQEEYAYTIAIPHDGNNVISDDITINVLVKYENGNIEEQDIIVSQETDSFYFKLK